MDNKRAVIFANGDMTSCEQHIKTILPGDLIIAADGGALNCLRCGISPQVVIGDFDSLPASMIDVFNQSSTQIIHYPAQKNETDLELAIQFAIKKDCNEIIIFAALGGRWDMSLANLLLLSYPHRQKEPHPSISIKIIDGNQEAFFLNPGQKSILTGQGGDLVSLVPLFQDVSHVTTTNLEYPLKAETLLFGSTRGISNVMIGDTATVAYRSGLLLCMITHHPSDGVVEKGEKHE